jgi:hypothetical protein
MKKYKQFLVTLYYLKSSPLHHSVKETASSYFSEHQNIEKATRQAMKDYKKDFDKLLMNDTEDTDSILETEVDD